MATAILQESNLGGIGVDHKVFTMNSNFSEKKGINTRW